jgi:alcohol dehydrogenase
MSGPESMRAWRFYPDGRRLVLETVPRPVPHPNGMVVRVEAEMVLGYLRQVLDGSLGYALPAEAFVPGTNAIGVIEEVGSQVVHLAPGQRVALGPRVVSEEAVSEPAQILIGLTAMGSRRFDQVDPAALALQRVWKDGVFAEFAHFPVACATPIGNSDARPVAQWAGLAKFVVPLGGWLRAGLQAGECCAVNGASGFYGSAAVALALALGASSVVAVGRDAPALDRLAAELGPRVRPVALGEEPAGFVERILAAAGPLDAALDLVGRARSSGATLACLRALRRGGRLVLMGSCSETLPLSFGEMLANDWSVAGQFMYPPDAPRKLVSLADAGALPLERLRVKTFPFSELEACIDAAAKMRGLDLTLLTVP